MNAKEIVEYDENNNLIHYKSSDGSVYWKEFDQNNKLIHFKNSAGLVIYSSKS